MNKRLSLILTVVLVVLSFTTGVLASGGITTITAYINKDLAIQVNGSIKHFVDANGTPIYPIVYNNHTYLPVRAVGEALGADVDYNDAGNGTVIIKSKNGFQDTKESNIEDNSREGRPTGDEKTVNSDGTATYNTGSGTITETNDVVGYFSSQAPFSGMKFYVGDPKEDDYEISSTIKTFFLEARLHTPKELKLDGDYGNIYLNSPEYNNVASFSQILFDQNKDIQKNGYNLNGEQMFGSLNIEASDIEVLGYWDKPGNGYGDYIDAYLIKCNLTKEFEHSSQKTQIGDTMKNVMIVLHRQPDFTSSWESNICHGVYAIGLYK